MGSAEYSKLLVKCLEDYKEFYNAVGLVVK